MNKNEDPIVFDDDALVEVRESTEKTRELVALNNQITTTGYSVTMVIGAVGLFLWTPFLMFWYGLISVLAENDVLGTLIRWWL